MTCNPDKPQLPPFLQLKATDCFVSPPAGFQPFEPPCVSDLEIDPSSIQTGGRAVVVVPYDEDVCSGSKGKFQVISGFGGQICDAIFLGNTVGRRETATSGLPNHRIGLFKDSEFTDDPDCLKRDPDVKGGPKGDRGLAVRDRGQWYVVRLGGEPSSSVNTAVAMGGNIPVPADQIPTETALAPNVVQAMVMTSEWDLVEVDIEELGKELLTEQPESGYYTDATTDPLTDFGLRPGLGVAWRYSMSLDTPEKELVYIINRVPGLAFMQGQPVFLVAEYQVPLLDENGDPKLDDDEQPMVALVYEAVG